MRAHDSTPSCCMCSVGAMGSTLAVEREWTKALCYGNSAALASMNAGDAVKLVQRSLQITIDYAADSLLYGSPSFQGSGFKRCCCRCRHAAHRPLLPDPGAHRCGLPDDLQRQPRGRPCHLRLEPAGACAVTSAAAGSCGTAANRLRAAHASAAGRYPASDPFVFHLPCFAPLQVWAPEALLLSYSIRQVPRLRWRPLQGLGSHLMDLKVACAGPCGCAMSRSQDHNLSNLTPRACPLCKYGTRRGIDRGK